MRYYFKKFLRIFGKVFLTIFLIVSVFLIWFNVPVFEERGDVKLGVTFSSRYSSDIGLDWRENYLAVLDDLKIRKIRIPVYWDLVEKTPGVYDFSEIDWQLNEAAKRNAEIILVLGQKVPRWPECAIPSWALSDDARRKEALLKFIKISIEKYENNHPEIRYWQIENEPFLPFGVCPKFDVNLLDSEIALARRLDPTRPVMVTDSGELSLWVRAAKRADVFGTTMYRTIWKKEIGYFTYPIGPRFFQFKHWLNRVFAGQNRAVVIELQAEPWIDGYTTNEPLEEQFKSMDVKRLRDNVSFAKRVGFPEVYLWGAEWWYWLKTEKNHPELWEAAREIFKN